MIGSFHINGFNSLGVDTHAHTRANTHTHTHTNFSMKSNFKKPDKRLVHIWFKKYLDIQAKTFYINSNIRILLLISSTIRLNLNLITHTHYTVSCEQYHISVECMVRISRYAHMTVSIVSIILKHLEQFLSLLVRF